MSMIQIGAIGVIGALLSIQLKSGKSEYGVYMSVAISILIFACIVDRLELFVKAVAQVNQFIKIDTSYIATMLKMVGITYIAEFSSSVCKDAGYQTIAVQIEIFSKLTILALGMPVLLALLETIREFLA
ncbi:SpoIIIAC/SpoIIIAD family protein [Faecalicatena contorta]|uniref:Stage III sporulation protein AD n=1 Tax=Faecalicatena contorta TaxID=39482 RepID=A0A316A3W5_9FIRM|nr:SpoIIIAC/SpoIIIAD family protein [Faecalicatena contorta]PWJ52209.1 stage III sporulation protein AD [Faecalicatena contorta]SUQ12487.1 stage III sporulation protein AD [Faecalicatena contorta]